MKFSMRAKLMGLIVLAGVLLLSMALLLIWTVEYRHQVSHHGTLFQREAVHVAYSLHQLVEQNVTSLEALISASRMEAGIRELQSVPNALPTGSPEEIDARWPSLAEQSPEMRQVLGNALSFELRAFKNFNPLFAEILLTDAQGRLIAATDKTTDYEQSDENWWQRAIRAGKGDAVLEGLEFDQSSGVFSLDIALPIAGPESNRPVGVLKAVMDVSPLFATVPVFAPDSGAIGDVVRSDGSILLRLSDEKFRPLEKSFPPAVMERMRGSAGWFIADLGEGGASMVGYAPVGLLGIFSRPGGIFSDPFYVVVHQPASAVLASLRQRTLILMALGSLIILVCAGAGIFFAQRDVLVPVEVLREAARAMVRTTMNPSQATSPAEAKEALHKASSIKTGDEMEDLAIDFSTMAKKLLRYQEDLKKEINAKTAEIQRDLDMAREFQQAFLPKIYPSVPSQGETDRLTLNFHHVYQAAMSVSGDFFDVVKLSDHSAGVLIADVMGHGTRSALVTAILRTLLHGLARGADDPSGFLSLLNHHFHQTLRQADQLIFASACYVVFDTREAVVRCASAGHPSPLIGNRLSGKIEPLFSSLRQNPALGLWPESSYTTFERPLNAEDVFILFTDGVVEAMNSYDESFALSRLKDAMADNLRSDVASLTQSILHKVQEFTNNESLDDDLCLVCVEAIATGGKRPAYLEAGGHFAVEL